MLLYIEQQTESALLSHTKQKTTQTLNFLICASCLFVNHFLLLLFFCLLCALRGLISWPLCSLPPLAQSQNRQVAATPLLAPQLFLNVCAVACAASISAILSEIARAQFKCDSEKLLSNQLCLKFRKNIEEEDS